MYVQHPNRSRYWCFASAATAAMFRYYDLSQDKFGELLSTDIALPRKHCRLG